MLHLHEAFPEGMAVENAALDCHAVILNIYIGHNKAIMQKCRKLEEYAIFIGKIREEVCSMLLTEYDEQAKIENEREIAKEEGQNRVNRLNRLLKEKNRVDDLLKAAKDKAFQEELFREFNL